MHGSLLGPEERPGFTLTGAGSVTRPSAVERRDSCIERRASGSNVGRGAERAPLGGARLRRRAKEADSVRPRGRRRARSKAESLRETRRDGLPPRRAQPKASTTFGGGKLARSPKGEHERVGATKLTHPSRAGRRFQCGREWRADDLPNHARMKEHLRLGQEMHHAREAASHIGVRSR